MPNLPPIIGEIRADESDFVRGAKRAGNTAQATAQQITREFESLGRKIGVSLSVAAFAGFVRAQAQAADQLAKTADKIGVTTERLQSLRFAARGAGVDVGALDNALLEAQKRLSEAAISGKGDAADWLYRLNLNIGKLRQLSPDQLFETYADAISKLTSRGDQVAAAQSLMGKSASELINLLGQGRPVLQQAAEDIKALGIEMTRVDAAQIEHANDAIDRLKAVSEGAGQQIARSLSPYIEALANSLVEAGKQGENMRTVFDTTARIVYYGFSIAANAVHVFDAAVSGVVLTIAKLPTIVAHVVRSILQHFQEANAGPRGFANTFLSVTQTLFETTAKLDRLVGLQTFAESFQGAAENVAKLRTDMNKLANQNIDKVLGGVNAVDDFWDSVANESHARISEALAGIQSLDQIGQEADRIVADSRRRAEEDAARRKKGAGTVQDFSTPAITFGDHENDRTSAVLLAQQSLFEQEAKLREKNLEDIESYTDQMIDIYATGYGLAAEKFRQVEELKREQQQRTIDAGVDLLQQLATKSKTAAVALILINKGLAIAQTIQNTAVAVTKAAAIYGPTPQGFAAIAAMKALGAAQIGLIAATGALQISSVTSSGGNSPGSYTNPVYTDDGASAEASQEPQKAVNVFITGVVTHDVIDQFLEKLDDRFRSGVVVIRGGSNQANEIVRAAGR